ncbi:aldo/keto reductase [Amycolatopsis alkalitolerans]|uniref:Aldo/keto reductase n=2 Tax=Amycolatopsis alkalitolerans TaxID=2547244 RepID=A0A5C4M324_9PSEU|nr:aldo/keto reductase [Amycolatopsis alkalitolerans]
MMMGTTTSVTEAEVLLDHAIELGINFVDTAEIYPIPVRPGLAGRTDRLLGDWMHRRRNRDSIVLSAKVAGAPNNQAIMGRYASLSYVRDGDVGLSRATIRAAVEDMLTRLRTDHLDLLQPHWPDRQTNAMKELGFREPSRSDGSPIEETLTTMGELVEEGKVRAIGVSNETAWGVSEYLRGARRGAGPRISTIQNSYNLLSRSYETALSEFSAREGVGLLAYCPLGMGTLTGKYLDNRAPVRGRLTRHPHPRYTGGQAVRATARYLDIAARHGIGPAVLAHAFVAHRPFVTATIVGASEPGHIDQALAAAEAPLGQELLAEIERVHAEIPNPAP